MIIRTYKNDDLKYVARLFYDTVHAVNAKDYSAAQLCAWAKNRDCLESRRHDLESQNTLIAEENGVIVGFGSIDKSGCLDLLYVHKDFQNRGIATALCDELEKGYSVIKTFASITAKPFFEKRGYVAVKSQQVERSGVKLTNFEMLKNKIKVYALKYRTHEVADTLLRIWEKSVKVTHTFLTDSEIKKIKRYVPQALKGVQSLVVAEAENGTFVAFMGIENKKIEMLFVSPEKRGQGIGKSLINYAVENFAVNEVAVNEQNTQAVGFYNRMGFKAYKRTELDEQGNAYPLLYMRL